MCEQKIEREKKGLMTSEGPAMTGSKSNGAGAAAEAKFEVQSVIVLAHHLVQAEGESGAMQAARDRFLVWVVRSATSGRGPGEGLGKNVGDALQQRLCAELRIGGGRGGDRLLGGRGGGERGGGRGIVRHRGPGQGHTGLRARREQFHRRHRHRRGL